MSNIRIFSRVTVCSADIRILKFEFLGHASQLIRIERNATVRVVEAEWGKGLGKGGALGSAAAMRRHAFLVLQPNFAINGVTDENRFHEQHCQIGARPACARAMKIGCRSALSR